MTVRVRFAPSPTGYLHIGGARAALYNWLWARKNGGQFILRVEDTDQERNTPESRQAIFDSLTWLGLDWDEGPGVGGPHGPYFQGERLDIYRDFAQQLIDKGAAYRCYATKEEIAEARAKHDATGTKEGFRFSSPWRDGGTPSDPNAPHVVRFRAPAEGSTAWNDLVKGTIEVQHSTLQDFVLLRHGGMPLYNMACVVDDLSMGITLVARGDDHMINTAPQILIYQALRAPVPDFAHLPLILAPNGQKLSKRFAAVSVTEYRDAGYLPDGVLNYLARLGWSHGDQEIFSREELIELFSWASVGRTGARYDLKKFEYVQAEHLRALGEDTLAELVVPFLAELDLVVEATDRRLRAALPYLKPRATTLKDLAEGLAYFFQETLTYDEKGRRKFLTPDRAENLRALAEVVDGDGPFTTESLENSVKAWLEGAGLSMKDVAQAARIALTGRTQSPGLFEVMVVLGKEVSLARLAEGARMAEGTAPDGP